MERGSGILLPIFSLKSKYGIGTFGSEAYNFVDFLEKSHQKYWQLLPLNPTSYGDSPYQSFSAFALNPYFIDLELLIKQGYITKEDAKELDKPYFRGIDYGFLYNVRFNVLKKAYHNSFDSLSEKIRGFVAKNAWAKEYAAFMVVKGLNDGRSWQEWSPEYQNYSRALLKKIENENKDEYNFWIWTQYIATKQYKSLKKYANKHGVKIVGDIPIYVALDSADVWTNQSVFQLDSEHRPTKVAGVPPDYFSATGQLWGNPLYDYEKMKENGFRWWKKRTEICSGLFDVLRIDHFRGMEAYWAVPYGDTTAINGSWIKGPCMDLVNAIKKAGKDMDVIAEDLGFLTQEVKDLKAEANWPGLKIYEFGFDAPLDRGNDYLPHNYEKECVAYIGTHDNDTLKHFIETKPELVPSMLEYLGLSRVEDIQETMIGSLMRSNAEVVIFTMQDLLHEGGEYRFNTPGTLGPNWQYRLDDNSLSNELADHLKALTLESGR